MQRMLMASMAAVCIVMTGVASAAEKIEPISLPAPQKGGGKPLMQALALRKSTRSFQEKKLSPQVLSNLLWAACGVNRPDSGKRTAPTAKDWQEIDVYVATADGLYIYNAKAHRLDPVFAGDIRASTGGQPFVKSAPVDLVYVADHAKMSDAPPEMQSFFAATDTGFVSQNVYLFCASEGLATVVLGWVDKPKLEKTMKLRPDQRVILSQPVGYPRE
ncbi:MAG: SagB/ThcOx family dehydrogenase [Chlamydiota bacterium]